MGSARCEHVATECSLGSLNSIHLGHHGAHGKVMRTPSTTRKRGYFLWGCNSIAQVLAVLGLTGLVTLKALVELNFSLKMEFELW